MTTPNNKSRRGPTRKLVRSPDDEIMELNTGDVIPLFDDELEILNDDAPQARPVPLVRPAAATKRPGPPVVDVESLETEVMSSLPARAGRVSDPNFSSAFVYVEKGPGQGQLIPILQGDLVVGRSSESNLQINHASVSRKHAVLTRNAEQYFLEDAGSQNGTYVNWARIRERVEIFPGDQVSVGSAVLVLRGGLYNSAQRRFGTTGPVEVPAPATDNTSKILAGIGIFGIAVGIGLALLVLSSSSSSSRSRHESELAMKTAEAARIAAEKASAEHVAAAQPPAPAPAPVAVAPAPTPAPVAPAEVHEAPARFASAPPAAELELASPRRGARVSHKAAKHEKVAAAAPVEQVQAPREVLKTYESGNLDGAIAGAEAAHNTKLASRISEFRTAYEAGKEALANKDGGGAISNLNKALKLDESIDSGWGKLNGEIRGELAGLYLLAGTQAEGRGDSSTAAKAFKAALTYQPTNKEARKKLTELSANGASEQSPAPAPRAAPTAAPSTPRSAADAAFDG